MPKPRQRPVYLNLFRLKLPVTGMVSILHRVTGVLLVLAIPGLLYLLDLSLAGEEGFQRARALLASWPARLTLLAVAGGYVLHLLAGVRHLLMDIDIGIELGAARRGAWGVLIATALLVTTLAGLWLA